MLETIVDANLLAAISTPLIYTWVIKPIVVARDAAFSQVNMLAETEQVTCHWRI